MKKYHSLAADCRNPWTMAAMALMTASAVVRLIRYGNAGLTGFSWWVYLAIPTAAALFFLVSLPLWGRKTLLPTCVSVFGGVFFFIVKAFTFAHLWPTVLCILRYLAVLVLYCLTVSGIIPTKKLLYPLFGLPLAFHLFVEDMKNYVLIDPPADFWTWMPEISVLCIMAGLLCLSFAMKKR